MSRFCFDSTLRDQISDSDIAGVRKAVMALASVEMEKLDISSTGIGINHTYVPNI